MDYFLDTEFNGFGGQLISLALVPEDDQAEIFYVAVICEAPTPWVRDHVLPVLHTEQVSRTLATVRLAAFLEGDAAPVVLANWPEDVAHFVLLMVTAPGARIATPTIRFDLLDLPLFDLGKLSRTPHNALSDASALKAYMLEQQSPN